jgi:Flp pilus assembly protein TadD
LAINPESLEARSLLAAVAYLEDRTAAYEAEVAHAHEINPVYGEIYRIVGSRAARAYRFPEAVSLVRRALQLNPDNTRAYADLGMHLLRTGDELGAREALDRSFEDDPFDIVTYNLLQMMDQLSEFETFEQGDLVVRIHPDEAPALKEYVIETAQEALDELTVRYGMTVQAPILVEVFPRHDDFAVRTLGLPGMLGALGACFGNVVTLDSPRARPPGDFNWLSTLWHEMAHVVTLQMSNQRLPRWLSEGISTYEEKRKQVAWGRDAVLDFAVALNEGSVLSIRDLNSGFTRPETISLTYFQASILVEHLIDTHGMTAMQDILRGYGQGLETDEVLARIGLDFDSLQASFDKAVEEQFGELRLALEKPQQEIPSEGPEMLEVLRSMAITDDGNFHVQSALGQAALEVGEDEEARKALERAASLVPMATGFDSPRGLLARIAQAEGDPERAMRELEMLLEYDETSIEAVRLYAALAEETGDQVRLGQAYERLIEIDPFDPISHQVLGRMALEDGRTALATRELTVALALDPVDRVAAHTDLAESLFLSRNFPQAKNQIMSALEIAPSYERAQELLLAIIESEL